MLDNEDLGDFDARIYLYTRDFGKISSKARSIRKITSKLAGHLQPLNIVQARLVNKDGILANVRLVDALKVGQLPRTARTISILNLIKELSAEGQSDPELWDAIHSGGKDGLTGVLVLSLLGFNPDLAVCQLCGGRQPANFVYRNLDYFCSACFANSPVKYGFFTLK